MSCASWASRSRQGVCSRELDFIITPPAGSDEPDLWSFAAVTDEPPPEVAAAGHDRCIVQLRPENVAAWLTPQGRTLDALDALLDDKARPYYEHRLAA